MDIFKTDKVIIGIKNNNIIKNNIKTGWGFSILPNICLEHSYENDEDYAGTAIYLEFLWFYFIITYIHK